MKKKRIYKGSPNFFCKDQIKILSLLGALWPLIQLVSSTVTVWKQPYTNCEQMGTAVCQ